MLKDNDNKFKCQKMPVWENRKNSQIGVEGIESAHIDVGAYEEKMEKKVKNGEEKKKKKRNDEKKITFSSEFFILIENQFLQNNLKISRLFKG